MVIAVTYNIKLYLAMFLSLKGENIFAPISTYLPQDFKFGGLKEDCNVEVANNDLNK